MGMIDATILVKRVLVMDDMASIRDAMIMALKGLGFTNITQAIDGQQGIEKVAALGAEKPFELIFSDIMMPKCTGIEFLKKLRALEYGKKIPVIMVTSENELSTVLEAVEAGANSYVLKPFTPKMIEQKIVEVFTKKAAAQK